MLNQILGYTYSSSSYNYSSSSNDLLGFMLSSSLVMILLVIILIPSILALIANWKIYSKMGEAGWKSLIPIYNVVILFEKVNINPLFILVALIPWVGSAAFFIIQIIANVRLCKGFGKSTGFTIGYILIGCIFGLILAFDKNATWDASRIDTNSCSFLNKDKNVVANAAPNMNANPGQPMGTAVAQPAQPVQPEQPAQPAQPVQPEQPSQPDQPTPNLF